MTAPYYSDALVTLFHGDCLEIPEWLQADVLVTDPPYGVRWEQSFGGNQAHLRKHKTHRKDAVAGDESPELRDRCLELWGTKPAIVFGTWRITRPPRVKSLLIWHKAGAFSGLANCAFMSEHEEIYVIGDGDWRKSAPPLMSVIRTHEHRPQQVRASGGHPTSKPLTLMEKLIDRCPPGVIADPFAGSGSTLVVARNQGRKAVGVEVEERYCELIAKRLDQMCLDFGEPA